MLKPPAAHFLRLIPLFLRRRVAQNHSTDPSPKEENLYLIKMAPESTPKKEKKDKKRKSEVADTSIAPEPVAPEEGTASAEAVAMEVDGDRALKKQKKEKKEKRKSLAAEGAEEVEDKKVCYFPLLLHNDR